MSSWSSPVQRLQEYCRIYYIRIISKVLYNALLYFLAFSRIVVWTRPSRALLKGVQVRAVVAVLPRAIYSLPCPLSNSTVKRNGEMVADSNVRHTERAGDLKYDVIRRTLTVKMGGQYHEERIIRRSHFATSPVTVHLLIVGRSTKTHSAQSSSF